MNEEIAQLIQLNASDKILRKFKDSSLNIISEEKLLKYIKFCLEKDKKCPQKFKVARHHILPKAKNLPFTKYINLKENLWNGVYLLHKDHYYAHYMLTNAIEHISILSSFCSMNNKDFKKKKIKECDLISPEEFQKVMERKNEEFSLFYTGSKKALKAGHKAKESKLLMFEKDGTLTNAYIEGAKKISETKILNSRKFNLLHIDFGLLFESVPLNEIRNISNNLKKMTKEKCLGYSNRSKKMLENIGKSIFIGLYVIEVEKNNLKGLKITKECIEQRLKEIC